VEHRKSEVQSTCDGLKRTVEYGTFFKNYESLLINEVSLSPLCFAANVTAIVLCFKVYQQLLSMIIMNTNFYE